MATPYIGEIRMGGFNFAPTGWAFCNGQLLSIADNDTLFALIGTTYGGDGVNTFGLPDLRGRIALHQGSGFPVGQASGEETVTLNTNQIPSHTHAFEGTQQGASAASPVGNVPAQTGGTPVYSPVASPRAMANAINPAGGSQPHDNMHPFQCVSFIIALEGIFPPR